MINAPKVILLASLAMTRIIFGGEPVTVGDRTCLFLDDRFVAEQSGLTRTWHQGRPEPKPAISATEPYESWVHGFGGVLYDPRAKVYRMYYESVHSPRRKPTRQSFTLYIHYAESTDGKTWTKPKLGLIEDAGSTENNIIMEEAELPVPFFDPKEPDERWRLKLCVLGGPAGGGTGIYQSQDGIRWQFVRGFEAPPFVDPAERKYSDANFIMVDEKENRYITNYRSFSKHTIAESKTDGRRRAIGISFADGLTGPWSPLVTVLKADDLDDQRAARHSRDPDKPEWAELYTMPLFNYGNHYLGMLSILDFVDGSDIGGDAGDLQFTFSHDGLTWYRQPDRQTMVAPSEATDLHPVYAMCTPPLLIDDRVWIYYTESVNAHPRLPGMRSNIRAATWRKDGFVSLDAAGKATLTTKPLATTGMELLVNFKTEDGGSVRVGLLDEDGKPISQFKLGECRPL